MEQMGYSFNYGLLLLVAILAAVAAGVVYFTRTRRRSDMSDSQLYIEALQAMVAGEDSTAFSKLKEVVAVRTDNLDAYIQLGDILRKHKKIDRATRVHQELTLREALSPRQRRAIYRSLTLDYITSGNTAAAEQALAELLKADKSDLWAAERLVRLYEDDGRWEEAFKMRSQIDRRLGNERPDVLALYKVYAGWPSRRRWISTGHVCPHIWALVKHTMTASSWRMPSSGGPRSWRYNHGPGT